MFAHRQPLSIEQLASEQEAAGHHWARYCLPRTAAPAPEISPAVASARKRTPSQKLVDFMRTFKWLQAQSDSPEKSPDERLIIRSPRAVERLKSAHGAAGPLFLRFEGTPEDEILAMTLDADLIDQLKQVLHLFYAVYWTEIAERFLETPMGRQLWENPAGLLGTADFPMVDLISATGFIFQTLMRGVISEVHWDRSLGMRWPRAGIIYEIVIALNDSHLREQLVSHLEGFQRARAAHRLWSEVARGSDLSDPLRRELEGLGFTVLAGDVGSLENELSHFYLPVPEKELFASVPDHVLRPAIKFLSQQGADRVVLLFRFDSERGRLQVASIDGGPGMMKEGGHWPIEEAVQTDEHLSQIDQRATQLTILTHHEEAGGAPPTGYAWSTGWDSERPVPAGDVPHGTFLDIEIEPDTQVEDEGPFFIMGPLRITVLPDPSGSHSTSHLESSSRSRHPHRMRSAA